MGTRAIVGNQLADGTYQARVVGLDGYPVMIVPFLAELVHLTFNGDQHAALAALLRTEWLALGTEPDASAPVAEPANPAIGRPINEHLPVETGRITRDLAGDKEWAYLFTGADLVVYRAVPVRLTRKRWKSWATWPITALPEVAVAEIERVQRTGIAEARDAHDFLSYMAAARRTLRDRP